MNQENLHIWGGIECTINRVHNQYFDQLDYAGHYTRASDLALVADLGIEALRFPVLWEKHMPKPDTCPDWSWARQSLEFLSERQIEPIVGLVHHGSGPSYVNFYAGSFEQGLADYARQVALEFPWITNYTPVNEPLTTARFCGLYGLWYPHGRDDYHFLKVLISECKATCMAMRAIREVNPSARLIQTEDMGKVYSTPLLRYQAEFENWRRWLSFDLLMGKVDAEHPLWEFILHAGINEEELYYFLAHPCPPDMMGLNYYVTSERYLDENLEIYPSHTHGGNGRHNYADVEAVRVKLNEPTGPYELVTELWQRYHIPLAITEVHLHCTREEQVRWFHSMWQTAGQLRRSGVDIRAITAWALFGSFGWNRLLTEPNGDYEPGVFKLATNQLQPTALARLIRNLTHQQTFDHPMVEGQGWWQSDKRVLYPAEYQACLSASTRKRSARPILILGKTGTLGAAFARVCDIRGLHYQLFDRCQLDITNQAQVEQVVNELKPWAIVNATGYVKVDEAERDEDNCIGCNATGPMYLAQLCERLGIKLLSFSSDLVFDGEKKQPYVESDPVAPLSVYGRSKALAEQNLLTYNPASLIVRTSQFFGPWDQGNFVIQALNQLLRGEELMAVQDVHISPTYVPDLVNMSLDLMQDDEAGIWHLSNAGQTTWAELARQVAERIGEDTSLIKGIPLSQMDWIAPRPQYSVLKSEKGAQLPSLDNALDRFFSDANTQLLQY
ncbi:dTDP-4-dehydrorhamnose reductase [Telluribacter sp. SYSU D00476]|uniref:dTDP-4-dehydrorhamnose reductase n=1 Tax=Telluribacter sp. SYSU D00476 TaxID=2811430 RepID=UPI001FF5F875|nr:dTDP-4-dehydrorhamnose reductase [Telluribacter sp. SYSU D00476]